MLINPAPLFVEIIAHEPIMGVSAVDASTGKTVESATRENAEPETLTTMGDAVNGNTTEEHKRIIQMATTLAHQTHIPAKTALQLADDEYDNKCRMRDKWLEQPGDDENTVEFSQAAHGTY